MAAFLFNPAELDQSVEVMALQSSGTIFTWTSARTICAAAETLPGKNLFSEIGIGVTSEKFTVRKQGLTLHNAFRWKGDHYFLTRIDEIRRLYYEVTAAKIEPKTCILKRTPKGKDALKRPISSPPQPVLTFPGCLVEKYQGFQVVNPQSRVNGQFVLVTPKEISMVLGDLVDVDGNIYNVQAIHDLDEFKNEYEIAIGKEA